MIPKRTVGILRAGNRGADPSLRDAEGRFPADLAEDNDAIRGTDVYRRLDDGRF